MYHAYRNKAVAAYSFFVAVVVVFVLFFVVLFVCFLFFFFFFFSFFFVCFLFVFYLFVFFFFFFFLQFSKIKIFHQIFLRNCWKLVTHVDFIVYTAIRLLPPLIHPFISSFFFLSSIQTFKFFITFVFFRGIKKETKQTWRTNTRYCVYCNQAAHTYSSRYFFLFLSLLFSVTNLSFSSDSGAIVRSSRFFDNPSHICLNLTARICIFVLLFGMFFVVVFSSFFFLFFFFFFFFFFHWWPYFR